MITIYTTHYCPYCHAAKGLLQSKGVKFCEIDVSEEDDFDDLVKKTGWKTVPQIFVGEKMIGGFQELSKLNSEGKLDELLKALPD